MTGMARQVTGGFAFRIAAVIAVAVALVSTAMPANADASQYINNGRYYFYCIDTANGNDGQYINLWSCNGGDNQWWAPAIDNNDGTVTLENIYYGKCLFADFASSRVYLYTCTGGLASHWYEINTGSAGSYNYKNAWYTGTCLDAAGGYNDAPITYNACNGSTTQMWGLNFR